ncbi:MAG: RNA polymerase sigma factor [Solirubrobacterales bacterium]
MGIFTMTSVSPASSTLQALADEDLIALAQRGELDAFEQLYERHKRAAYSLARRIVGGDGNADDVVQETFISVWRSIERYDPKRASVRTWLMRIVHRRAIDALRSQMVHLKRRADGEGLAEGVEAKEPTPDAVAVQHDESSVVHGVLEDLPGDQRKVIELAYFNGFTHSEIAEMLDVPLGTIKGRMRLGLEKMRTTLEESGEIAASG